MKHRPFGSTGIQVSEIIFGGGAVGGIIGACRTGNAAVMALRIFAAGIIATDERTGRESMLTADTSLAEEERNAKAVFEASAAAKARVLKPRCALCYRTRMFPATSSAARNCSTSTRRCRPPRWGRCRRRCWRGWMRSAKAILAGCRVIDFFALPGPSFCRAVLEFRIVR